MKNKFKPFAKLNELEIKGIKKKKIIMNVISCFVLILFLIFLAITTINTVIEYNEHIKNAKKCSVLIKENIDYSYFDSDYQGIQIISTGENVTVDPMLRSVVFGVADNIYPVGKEFDAVCYMYNGKKTVSLSGMILLILYKPISLIIWAMIGFAVISVVTYRRIKTVNSPNRKETTKEKRRKIERTLFSLSFLLILIMIIFPEVILTLTFISITYVFTLISTTIYTVTDNYYINLIPPGPTDDNQETL